eukprot:TRINITY_DN2682_c0_g1_i4.p1 TRINITY_DN2682_c0_g1~~TRINITY_DN2682_c0_g1_i4.p1  ORF type:complete len:131 (-),score=69.58 TRINITY_DN2682_c0_g1_i4:30-422(-)
MCIRDRYQRRVRGLCTLLQVNNMPPKKAAAPASKKAAAANKGGKKTTKKWSKGKSRDPLQNAVMFDQVTLDKLEKEVPKYKLITPSVISDRLKISVAVAGHGLVMLAKKGAIKLVSSSAKFKIYTRAIEA